MKLCECGCGLPAPITLWAVKRYGYSKGQPKRFIRGHHKGCLRHGATLTPEYKAFTEAKRRCRDQTREQWPNYGGRGIRFCFSSFEEFLAEIGPRPSPEYSLDRINNDGNYEPGNIRWATRSEQRRNQRKGLSRRSRQRL